MKSYSDEGLLPAISRTSALLKNPLVLVMANGYNGHELPYPDGRETATVQHFRSFATPALELIFLHDQSGRNHGNGRKDRLMKLDKPVKLVSMLRRLIKYLDYTHCG